ncbi:hypothetical protein EI94DRAFT_753084 [Lactarius quietus]|nr:hypothetical protein EI94DRAFT_753084 [Lactarius quietus]
MDENGYTFTPSPWEKGSSIVTTPAAGTARRRRRWHSPDRPLYECCKVLDRLPGARLCIWVSLLMPRRVRYFCVKSPADIPSYRLVTEITPNTRAKSLTVPKKRRIPTRYRRSIKKDRVKDRWHGDRHGFGEASGTVSFRMTTIGQLSRLIS